MGTEQKPGDGVCPSLPEAQRHEVACLGMALKGNVDPEECARIEARLQELDPVEQQS